MIWPSKRTCFSTIRVGEWIRKSSNHKHSCTDTLKCVKIRNRISLNTMSHSSLTGELIWIRSIFTSSWAMAQAKVSLSRWRYMSTRVLRSFLGSQPYLVGFLTFRSLHLRPHSCWRLKSSMAASLSTRDYENETSKAPQCAHFHREFLSIFLWHIIHINNSQDLSRSIFFLSLHPVFVSLATTWIKDISGQKIRIYILNMVIHKKILSKTLTICMLRCSLAKPQKISWYKI